MLPAEATDRDVAGLLLDQDDAISCDESKLTSIKHLQVVGGK